MKGNPSVELLVRSSRKHKFVDSRNRLKVVRNSRGIKKQPGSKKLSDILKGADSYFIDLVERCIEWDPLLRITPRQALKHPWVTD